MDIEYKALDSGELSAKTFVKGGKIWAIIDPYTKEVSDLVLRNVDSEATTTDLRNFFTKVDRYINSLHNQRELEDFMDKDF